MKFYLIIWGSLIIFSYLIFGCISFSATPPRSTIKESATMNTSDPNRSISSDDSVSPNSDIVIPQKTMIIEGTIEQVMETSPLQLTITTNSDRYYVALQDNTTVTQQGNAVNPLSLKPGLRVRIEGQQSAEDAKALKAQTLVIQ